MKIPNSVQHSPYSRP